MGDPFDFDDDGQVSEEEEEEAFLLFMDDDDEEEEVASSNRGGCLSMVLGYLRIVPPKFVKLWTGTMEKTEFELINEGLIGDDEDEKGENE